MKLVFASSNANKLHEIRSLIPQGYTLISLTDLHYDQELEETGETLEENALQKARFVNNKFGIDCFADDSGLEVEALDGQPGVHSAYYNGLPRNDTGNMQLLLSNMQTVTNRTACFKTVIALVLGGRELFFTGKLTGIIAHEPRGTEGFGYDPVFIPSGYNMTLAELGVGIKNQISHRKMALKQMTQFLAEASALNKQ